MADSVKYHLERMLPELEDLEERGIFSRAEVKSIIKRRTDFEYAIHRRISKKSDYLRYIEYEMNLEKLRKKRKMRLRLDKKPRGKNKSEPNITLSDHSILRRIHQLYHKLLKKFSGDVHLWIQYLEWARQSGSSKLLGKSFARVIQYHPTKPVFWIMAAAWEYEENSNISSARVLLQRGLRLNPESQKLWLEYFKLELLWLIKIRERRRLLFGEGGKPKKSTAVPEPKPNDADKVDVDLDDEDDDDNRDGDEAPTGVSVPSLSEESGLENPLENDPVISKSLTSEPESVLEKSLSPMQKALLELAIPRAIYRNAVKAIASNLPFRLEFLELYRQAGDDTQIGQDEIYQSLATDFGDDPVAISAICERYLTGLTTSDPGFPAALKMAIDEYKEYLTDTSSPVLCTRYLRFLSSCLARTDEENLRAYISKLLRKTFVLAHDLEVAEPTAYIMWSDFVEDKSEKEAALTFGIDRHPTSIELHLAYIKQTMHKGAEFTYSHFQAAVKAAAKQDKHTIWIPFIDWVVSESNLPAKDVERTFNQSATVSELGYSEYETPLLVQYIDWAHKVGGIAKCREVCERLRSLRTRQPEFYERWIQIETELCSQCSSQTSKNKQIKQIRKVYEILIEADTKRHDSWLSCIEFEMEVSGDMTQVTHLHWRALKEVDNQDAFSKGYEALKQRV
ncbi:U3 small nucleolar RNA-associated protein 6-domain-containing protein [Polychytrium aggregatum]|uniref:U3 small nucleolar RNA-associated protein 6-domain-containing protein n=1 Tax=Polychytrium aggregatum TaxID=110093 RepID=UPI0022FE01E7|nr:U3 small nucleolar RNA-associated protein 6-domain-containing protein [Polychytrium aggregatum]KAI9190583.1 U3 small nucleolar RNA-associated protein 6-domain-containing protein [Polychytrium aggregatum]